MSSCKLLVVLVLSVALHSIGIFAVVPPSAYPLVWSDDFGGTELDRRYWSPVVNCWGHGESKQRQCYTKDNILVSDGVLSIVPKAGNYSGTLDGCTPYSLAETQSEMCTRSMPSTSGMLSSYNQVEIGFNSRVEIRARLPLGRYMWPAFWLYAASPEGRLAELDIIEAASGKGRYWSETTLHYENLNGTMEKHENSTSTDYDLTSDFRLYTMDINSTHVLFYQESDLVHHLEYATLPNQPFHQTRLYFILNVAIGGVYFGADDVPDDAKLVADRAEWTPMLVDYVRAYGNVTTDFGNADGNLRDHLFRVREPIDFAKIALLIGYCIEWIVYVVVFGSVYRTVATHSEKTTSGCCALLVFVTLVLLRALLSVSFAYAMIPGAVVPWFLSVLIKIAVTVFIVWWIFMTSVPITVGLIRGLLNGFGDVKLEYTLEELENGLLSDPHMVYVILPVYNEELPLLLTGIDALCKSEYDRSKLELHISFDDENVSDLYLGVLAHLKLDQRKDVSLMTEVNGTTVWVHRWIHGGKRIAQGNTYRFIRDRGAENDAFVILTDSDNEFFPNAINNLSVSFRRHPDKDAFAGYMSCKSKEWNMMRMLQDTEYVACELNRYFELLMGTVNCLPGGFTAIRWATFDSVAPAYFGVLPSECITQYHQHVLGEDRYLTHLLHQKLRKNAVGFCSVARCKTDPPATVCKFVKQRRRWLLGTVANEAYLLSDPGLWKKFPIMCAFKLFQNCNHWSFFVHGMIMFGAIMQFVHSGSSELFTYVALITIPLAVANLCAFVVGCAMGHYKVGLMWFIMVMVWNPLHLATETYTLYSWRHRTWGTRGAERMAEQPAEEVAVATK